MKRIFPVLTLVVVGIPLAGCSKNEPAPNPTAPTAPVQSTNTVQNTNLLKTDFDKTSYAIGLNIGTAWKQQDIDVDYNLLLRGIKDAKADAKAGVTLLLSDAEAREVINKLRQDLMARQQQKQKEQAEKLRAQGEKNKTDGEAFLAANKDKPGIITLPSGLQYKILTEGAGESPKPEDVITASYRGTLIDGTEFDASPPGQPFTRPANQVIRGWTEALTRMKPGAKWQLFIPADLAYGERGSPPKIGPQSALIFDVELLSAQAAPPPPPPPPPAQPLTSDIIKVPSLEEMKKGAKIETIKAEDVEKLQKQAQPPEKKDEKK